jgi:molecular chaperone HscB
MINYFELYGLQVNFHPNESVVRKKFYELSRQFHPDRFAQAGDKAIEEALKMSAMINEGYKILTDRDATIQYVLKFEGMLEDEEKYSLPADFLMEMMELNEAVSEYEMEPSDSNRQLAVGSLETQAQQLQRELETLTQKFDSGDHSRELLTEVKDYYFRKKYLLRVQERIAKFATP